MVTLGVFGYVPYYPLRTPNSSIHEPSLTTHGPSINSLVGLVAANGVLKSIDGLPLGEFILQFFSYRQFY